VVQCDKTPHKRQTEKQTKRQTDTKNTSQTNQLLAGPASDLSRVLSRNVCVQVLLTDQSQRSSRR